MIRPLVRRTAPTPTDPPSLSAAPEGRRRGAPSRMRQCRFAAAALLAVALAGGGARAQDGFVRVETEPYPAGTPVPAAALRAPQAGPTASLALPAVTAAERERRRGLDAARPARYRLIDLGFGREPGPGRSARAAARLAWLSAADGASVGSLAVTSPGAAAVRARFVFGTVPAGTELRFYDPAAPSAVLGPVLLPPAGATLWSPTVAGETVALEIALPPGAAPDALAFAVDRVSHLERSAADLAADASACGLDPAWSPEVLAAPAAASVAQVHRVNAAGGSVACTGTLLADGDPATAIPYLLTANHCVPDAAAAAAVELLWFHERGRPGAAPVRQSGGAVLLAAHAARDFSLLRLNTAPPPGAAMAGWSTRSLAAGEDVVAAHHPGGGPKVLSVGGFREFARPGAGPFTDARVVYVAGGTQAGSSGSALWRPAPGAAVLVGSLTAGESSCDAPGGYDHYARFDQVFAHVQPWLYPRGVAGPAPDAQLVDAATGAAVAFGVAGRWPARAALRIAPPPGYGSLQAVLTAPGRGYAAERIGNAAPLVLPLPVDGADYRLAVVPFADADLGGAAGGVRTLALRDPASLADAPRADGTWTDGTWTDGVRAAPAAAAAAREETAPDAVRPTAAQRAAQPPIARQETFSCGDEVVWQGAMTIGSDGGNKNGFGGDGVDDFGALTPKAFRYADVDYTVTKLFNSTLVAGTLALSDTLPVADLPYLALCGQWTDPTLAAVVTESRPLSNLNRVAGEYRSHSRGSSVLGYLLTEPATQLFAGAGMTVGLGATPFACGEETVWATRMTVGDYAGVGYGYDDDAANPFGALDADGFDYAGVGYTVQKLYNGTTVASVLALSSDLPAADLDRLHLCVQWTADSGAIKSDRLLLSTLSSEGSGEYQGPSDMLNEPGMELYTGETMRVGLGATPFACGEEVVWSTRMTVGNDLLGFGYDDDAANPFGALDSAAFDYAGVGYTVHKIYNGTSGASALALSSDLPAADLDDLQLCVQWAQGNRVRSDSLTLSTLSANGSGEYVGGYSMLEEPNGHVLAGDTMTVGLGGPAAPATPFACGEEVIWSTEMTVGTEVDDSNYGYSSGEFGELDGDEFHYAGVDYTVGALYNSTNGPSTLALSEDLPAADLGGLRLCAQWTDPGTGAVGSDSVALSDLEAAGSGNYLDGDGFFLEEPGKGVVPDGGKMTVGLGGPSTTTTTAAHGDLRLTGGTATSGRLEVYDGETSNAWGLVCDDRFGAPDAQVACRQLGHAGGEALYGADVPTGPELPFLLDDLLCAGDEAKLIDCPGTPFGTSNCTFPAEQVGVSCPAATATPVVTVVADGAATEGDDVVFTVTRTAGGTLPALVVGVMVTEIGDTLAPGGAMSVTIAAGDLGAQLTLSTVDDAAAEDDGIVTVTLSASADGSYAVGAPAFATATVYDNDGAAVAVEVSAHVDTAAGADRVTEGDPATFLLLRGGTGLAPLTVAIAVTGDAIAGTAPTTARFEGGAGEAAVSVPTTDDAAVDTAVRGITLTVLAGAGYAVGRPDSATVTVVDDDGADLDHCAADDIWCTTMTVGWHDCPTGTGDDDTDCTWRGFDSGTSTGSLADDAFDRAGVSYTVERLAVSAPSGVAQSETELRLDVAFPAFTDPVLLQASSATATADMLLIPDVDPKRLFAWYTAPLLPSGALPENGAVDVRLISGCGPADVWCTSLFSAIADEPVQVGFGSAGLGGPIGGDMTFLLDGTEHTVDALYVDETDGLRFAVDPPLPDALVARLTLHVPELGNEVFRQESVPLASLVEVSPGVYGRAQQLPDLLTLITLSWRGPVRLSLAPDVAPASVGIVAVDPVVEEGADARFLLTRTGGTTLYPLTVALDVAGTPAGVIDGTAPASATFAAGQTEYPLDIGTAADDDDAAAPDGAVVVHVAPGAGYAAGVPSAAGVTVTDPDGGVSVDACGRAPEPAPGEPACGDLRLADGSAHAGRLEVYVPAALRSAPEADAWGTVCDDGFDDVEAFVACRQLGLGGGRVSGAFPGGPASADIWLDDLRCTGAEAGLVHCRSAGPGLHNCGHHEDAGVACDPPGPPVAVTVAAGTTPVAEGEDAVFDVRRAQSSAAPLLVSVTVTESGAMLAAGQAATHVVRIPPDAAAAELRVATEDDAAVETDSVVTARIAAGAGYAAVAPDSATVTVEDDDEALATVTIAPVATPVTEGDPAQFRVTRSGGDTSGLLLVELRIDETGSMLASSGTRAVIFPPSDPWVEFSVATIDDNADEPDSVVTAQVAAVAGYVVGTPGSATVTVEDDDAALPGTATVTVVAAATPVAEGDDAQFTLTRTGGDLAATLDVELAVSEDGAMLAAGESGTRTVTFAADAATAPLTAATIDDNADEPDSVVTARVESGTGYSPGTPGTASVIVQDDDGAAPATPTVTIAAARTQVAEGDDAEFTLTRTGGDLAAALDVELAVSEDGDVVAAGDEGTKTARFDAGARTATLAVPTEDDSTQESASDVEAALVDGADYDLGTPSEAVVRVTDDDGPATEGDVRLADGGGPRQGRVEVYLGGRWGTVCDDFFNQPEATVVCRQLGMDGGAALTRNPFPGGAALPILLDDLHCTGAENGLADCPHAGVGLHNCTHAEDAGVSCGAAGGTPTVGVGRPAAAVDEGDDALFTLTRAGGDLASTLEVTVTVTETGAMLAAGQSGARTATFAPNAASATVAATTAADAQAEPDSVVTLRVAAGAGYLVGAPASASVTVRDDDGAGTATVTIARQGAATVTEGTAAQFAVTRSGGDTAAALAVAVTVNETGTMLASGQGGTRTATFQANATTATLTASTTNDTTDEPDSTVTARVVSGAGYAAGTPSSATVTVADDDEPPPGTATVTIARLGAATVTEGASAQFRLTRSGGDSAASLAVAVTVDETGTMLAAGQGGTRTAAFLANATTATLTAATTNDTTDEPDSTVTARVVSGAGYAAGTPGSATVTVEDDDLPAPAVPTVTVAAVATPVTEGTPAQFTLTRTGAPTGGSLAVSVSVGESGSMLAPGQAGPKTVVFGPGDATATLTATTANDMLDEANSAVTAEVVAGSGYLVGGAAAATVTVRDDDETPAVSVSAVESPVPEGRAAAFALARTGDLAATLTATVTVAEDGDMLAAGGAGTHTVTFVAAASGATLSLDTVNDGTQEPLSTVTATVVAGADYDRGSPGSATVQVTDNDAPGGHGELRLSDGPSALAGRLEVYLGGHGWGTVCDDRFNTPDAEVACRQLGHGGGTELTRNPYPGGGGLPILLDDLQCDGTESRLIDCTHVPAADQNCAANHSEDVGVSCAAD